jgi:hypothetical protein
MLHQHVSQGLLVWEKTIQRADLRVCPRGDLRHRRGLEPALLDHGRRRLHKLGHALAADLSLRFERMAVPA